MLDLSSRVHWPSQACSLSHHARTKCYKRAVHVPPDSSVQSYKTQSTPAFTPHPLQCSSRNHYSPSSLPSLWSLASPPPPSRHATSSPSAPQASTRTAAPPPLASAVCRTARRMRSPTTATWTRASRCVWVALLPRRKDGTVSFLHFFFRIG